MDLLNFQPEKELKTIWFTVWFIGFSITVLALASAVIFIPDIAAKIAFGIILSIFIVIMVLLLLWIPPYFRSLEYSIDGDTVKMNCGVIWKKRVTVPFRKITNVDISQGPLERIYNIGMIHVQTAGAGGAQGGMAELRFSGIRELDELKERIMNGVRGSITSSAINPAEDARVDKSELSLLSDILGELRALKVILKDK